MLPNTPALVTSTSTSLAIVTVTSWNADTENESGGFVRVGLGVGVSLSVCLLVAFLRLILQRRTCWQRLRGYEKRLAAATQDLPWQLLQELSGTNTNETVERVGNGIEQFSCQT